MGDDYKPTGCYKCGRQAVTMSEMLGWHRQPVYHAKGTTYRHYCAACSEMVTDVSLPIIEEKGSPATSDSPPNNLLAGDTCTNCRTEWYLLSKAANGSWCCARCLHQNGSPVRQEQPALLAGVDPLQTIRLLRLDKEGCVQLGDEQVERIAERVVALLYERNRAGRGG